MPMLGSNLGLQLFDYKAMWLRWSEDNELMAVSSLMYILQSSATSERLSTRNSCVAATCPSKCIDYLLIEACKEAI